MIKILEVSRNGPMNRYEIQLQDGKFNWFVDLNDLTHKNPEEFSRWLRSFTETIQRKRG